METRLLVIINPVYFFKEKKKQKTKRKKALIYRVTGRFLPNQKSAADDFITDVIELSMASKKQRKRQAAYT